MSDVADTLRGVGVDAVLGRQAGVISRAQAIAEGMGAATISRRTSRGLWVRVHPRVYFATGHALTAEARLRAAYLWAGPAATVSGPAAAWWHGLWADPPGIVEIAVPHRRRLPAQRGVQVRRCDLHPADRVELNALWVTAAPLTALQAALALGGRGPQLLDRALRHRVTFADPARHVLPRPRPGRLVGRRQVAPSAGGRAASAAERIMATLLRAGPRRLAQQLPGRCLRAGLRLPAGRVAIEIDGWAWHSDADRFRHDRRRQNALVLAGWTVLRFTWHDLTTRPDAVISEVQAALRVA